MPKPSGKDAASKAPNTTAKHFTHKTVGASLDRKPARDVLAADVAAFQQSGGVIEKLGTTCTFKHLANAADAQPNPLPGQSSQRAGPAT